MNASNEKISSIIFIGIVGIFSILATVAFFGLLDQKYDYNLHAVNHIMTLTLGLPDKIEKKDILEILPWRVTPDGKVHLPELIIDPELYQDRTIALRSIVSFHTTSLSAQNPIHAIIRLEPTIMQDSEGREYDWSQMPKIMFVIFDGALLSPKIPRENGEYATAVIELKRTDGDDPHYFGEHDIEYQFEKGNGYFFITWYEAISHLEKDNYVVIRSNEFKDRIGSGTVFPVGSSDQTITLSNNRFTMSLTFVFVVFGMLSVEGRVIRSINEVIKSLRPHCHKISQRWRFWRLSKKRY